MAQEHRGPARGLGGGLDDLVERIWEESTRLETVLVVHAHGSLRDALARTLQHYGYRALEAGSREQALRMVRGERPAVVLLDLALPGDDARALAAELRARPEWREIPVVALTSASVSPAAAAGAGFHEILSMPTEQRQLLRVVDQVLKPSRRRAAALAEPVDEQCRLQLEDGLRAEHLSLLFRFPASTRAALQPGSESRIKTLSSRLAALGIQPEILMDDGNLLLRYEVTIADALWLEPGDAPESLFHALCDAFPELAARPDALRQRISELVAEYRRLQKMAS